MCKDRRREADQIVQQRMAELDVITQSLAGRAAGIEREATAFVAEVEQVRWRLARLAGEDAHSPERARPPAAGGGAHEPLVPQAIEIFQAAALRATQMAVAGAERADIEHMLRDSVRLGRSVGARQGPAHRRHLGSTRHQSPGVRRFGPLRARPEGF